MAKLRHENLKNLVQPSLRQGENLEHVAYGVKQPHFSMIFLIMLLCIAVPMFLTRDSGLLSILMAGVGGGVGGAIIYVMTKHFALALTDQRMLVIQFRMGKNWSKIEEWSYSRAQVKTTGFKKLAFITTAKFQAGTENWALKFNRKLAVVQNGVEIDAIERKLTAQALS